MLALLITLAGILVNLLLSLLAMYLGLRLLKVPGATLARVSLVVLVVSALGVTLMLAGLAFDVAHGVARLAWEGLTLAVTVIATVMLSVRVCRATVVRALLAWLMTIPVGVLALAFALLVIRPFVLEAFTMASGGMTPTVRSPYHLAVCPNCQGPLVVPQWVPPLRRPGMSPPPETPRQQRGICERCFASTLVETRSLPAAAHDGDHFLVAKYLKPQRWDIVAYRHTSGNIFLQRVVGLPGETVAIKNGHVLIDGTPLSPPADTPRLNFRFLHNPNGPTFGDPDEPTRLKAGEFFVLGDFTDASLDSRYLGPIPAGTIEGVVSLTFWPPSRFHLYR